MFDLATYRQHVEEAVAAVRPYCSAQPKVGIILGTGLGALAKEIEVETEIIYDDIPHFPISTVESHHGRLLIGTLDSIPIIAMQGRFHLYEGYTAQEITLPVRMMALLDIETLLISNAAGAMNPIYRKGDLMLLTDHINLLGVNPLMGPNAAEWGPRFPDMSEPYDVGLRNLAEKIALNKSIRLQQGVYVSVTGPNLETKAEYRFLRRIGADAVGMSTIPEVIVARHMNLRCMAISVLTDECFPDALEPVSIPDILAAAAQAEPNLTTIFRGVVSALHTAG